MSAQKFETSKETGEHHQLNLLAGEWEGNTKTWFEPGDPVDESPMKGTMRSILGGRFMMHEYQGSFQGKSFEGIAIYGYALDTDKYQTAWIDSYHMGTAIMFSEGSGTNKNFSALGSYYAGNAEDGSEIRWGWRTEIEIVSKDRIIITAYNITPDGTEVKATETTYARKL